MMLRIGDVLYGYCGGYFGDSYEDKRVEALGADWIIAREIGSGDVCFADEPPERVEEYKEKPDDES